MEFNLSDVNDSMKEALSEIAIAFASFAAIVAALDFFLTDAHKNCLNRLSLVLWYRLARIKVWEKLEIYKSDDFFAAIFVYGASIATLILTISYSVAAILSGEGLGVASATAGIGSAIALTSWLFYRFLYSINPIRQLALKIHNWVLKGNSVALIFAKSTFLLFALGFIALTLRASEVFLLDHNIFVGVFFSISVTVLAAPLLIGFGVVDMLFIRILLLGLLGIPIVILEYLARRIAEYEKGALLGVSALIGSVGVILKALS